MQKYSCKYCGKEYDSAKSMAAHCSHCKYVKSVGYDVLNTNHKKRQSKKQKYIVNCEYCGKEYEVYITEYAYSIHKYKKCCCKECTNKYIKEKLSSSERSYKHSDETKKKISEARIKAHLRGDYHYKKWTEEDKQIASVRSKQINKEYWTDEKRKEHSEKMKKIVADKAASYSVNNISGRVKFIKYKDTFVHGKWELQVAKWLDKLNIKWTNKIEGIKYLYNDHEHLYFPDFYIEDLKMYIEVKGYETERDKIKWDACKNQKLNLLVLKRDEILQITENENIPIEYFEKY